MHLSGFLVCFWFLFILPYDVLGLCILCFGFGFGFGFSPAFDSGFGFFPFWGIAFVLLVSFFFLSQDSRLGFMCGLWLFRSCQSGTPMHILIVTVEHTCSILSFVYAQIQANT